MKALVGSWDHRPYQLLAEVTALRSRVRELQEALDAAERENERLRAELGADLSDDLSDDADREVVLSR